MSEAIKGAIIGVIILFVWSFACFGTGYLLCDRRATERIEQSNNELREQQQKYEELIRLADERLQRVKEDLYGTLGDNGQTITELSGIIEQIKRQRIDI